MKLTEKSMEVFNYVKANGGRVDIAAIAEALGRGARSIGANVTDLQKKGLVIRDKVKVEDAEVTQVVLTDAGATFVPGEDAE